MKHLKASTFLWVFFILLSEYNTVCFSCVEEERIGLLKLKPLLWKWLDSSTPYRLPAKQDTTPSWVDDENSDCCGWELVQCDNTTRRVTQLNLQQKYTQNSYLNASSFLPFRQLQYLDLSENQFLGFQNLQDLGRLKQLEVLILADNEFNTSIFQSLSTLTSLTVLDLARNSMNGSLSEFGRGLCKLKNLQELDLTWNMLSGSIPSCFNNLTSLKVLDLSKNNLGGDLDPSLLSSLTSLEFFSLKKNLQFEGNLMITSLVGLSREFQLVSLSLPNCNLNLSTTELVNIFANQYNLMELDLSHNNLYGEFSNSLFETNSKLLYLTLKNNSLVGHIHFKVGSLVNLSLLDLSNNHIQGELQPNIGEIFSQLMYLNISSNHLAGRIPELLPKYLQILDLSDNNLSDKLPERLDLNCQDLSYILLSNNKLEGQISHTLFNLTWLSILDLSNNQLTGNIPNYNFQLLNLRIFDISQNQISGRIPPWVSNLTNPLGILAMHDNSIEGYIPPELCNSTDLKYLDLSRNQLSGPMPSCLIAIPSLRYLHLQRNKLTAPLLQPLLKNSGLLTLDLKHNNLSGQIPNWFGLLLSLRVLLLQGNHFSGSIPHELCLLKMTGIMDLSHNNLSGSIPPCFTNITFGRFAVFGLDETFYRDTGSSLSFINEYIFPSPVPRQKSFYSDAYERTPDQEEVEFMMKSRTNSYKGEIINFMSGMDLSCNNLKGNIPPDIGALTEIRALNLSHNQLTGLIPKSLANMKQIESIDLSHNKLSGGIPSSLTGLNTLAAFNVAYNNLSGRVPEMEAQFSTFDETSYEGNPFLCGPPLLGKQCNAKKNPVTMTDTLVGHNDIFGIEPVSFLASFAASYVTCLLGFVIVLYINSYCRRRWLHFIDACLSFVFLFCSKVIHRKEI